MATSMKRRRIYTLTPEQVRLILGYYPDNSGQVRLLEAELMRRLPADVVLVELAIDGNNVRLKADSARFAEVAPGGAIPVHAWPVE